MTVKKYEFTGEIKEFYGRTLHRIKRISDGLIGGWIESEENLSHKDDCFVYGEAVVCGEAEVCGKARVYGKAVVYGKAEVYGKAVVCGEAEVYGEARVYGEAVVDRFKIISEIASKFKYIFQLQCKHRLLTAILKDDGQVLYSIGCQTEISKDTFIDRIYNHGGGLRENPHRQEYLVAIELAEKYFEVMQNLDGDSEE